MTIKVTRTRKARSGSRCNLCQQPIMVGQVIALLGQSWVHCECACEWLREWRRQHPEEDSNEW